MDPALSLYGPDGFHPSPTGSYLAALVMFERITGKSPIGLPASLAVDTPSSFHIDLDPDTALLLQQAAAEANAAIE